MILNDIPDVIIIDILTNYLCINDFGKFEIGISNTNNTRYFKNLISNKWFVLKTNQTIYDILFKNKNFINWLINKNVNIDKLIILENNTALTQNIFNYEYIKKISSSVILLEIIKMSNHLNKIKFENLKTIILNDGSLNYKLFNIANCKNIQILTLLNNINTDTINDFFVEEAKSLKKISIGFCRMCRYKNTINLNNNTLINIINKCANLSIVNLYCCYNINDESIAFLINKCIITELSLNKCVNITDKSILEMAKEENKFNVINLKLYDCYYITDISIVEIAKKCKNIQILEFNMCELISYISINTIAENCIHLIEIKINQNIHQCSNIHTKSLCNLINKCKKLKNIHIYITNLSIEHYNLLIELSKLKSLEILILTSGFLSYNKELESKINNGLFQIIKNNSIIKSINVKLTQINLVECVINIFNNSNQQNKILCEFYTNNTTKHVIIVKPYESIAYTNILSMNLKFEAV